MKAKPYIIVINAVSGGGKTTVVKALQKRMPNTRALYFDDRNYDCDSGIDDICQWVEEGADVERFDLRLLAEDLDRLIDEKPLYIIMDYPFDYRHSLIARYIDFSVYIDTPLDIALARRVLRDYSVDTASAVFDEMKQYLCRGRSAYLDGLGQIRASADFVVDGSLSVDEIAQRVIAQAEGKNS